MRRRIAVLIAALLVMLAGARAADGPYVFGATQYGPTVDVRFRAPEGGVLVLGVYDRAAHTLTGVRAQAVTPGGDRQVVRVEFEQPLPGTESVTAFLLETDTLRPLCRAVLADVVVWSGEDDLDGGGA